MEAFEQKYCIGTQDGNHKIIWDIQSMCKALKNNEASSNYLIKYSVEKLIKQNNFYGNTDYALKTDIKIPLIIAKFNDDKEKLIDGNHRLYKAHYIKQEKILCYVLPFEYHSKFILDFDMNTYIKIINEF